MTPLLAAFADDIIIEGFLKFLIVAAIAAAFGFVYWLVRRAKSRREDAARRAWIEDRRAKRGAQKSEPADGR